MKKINKGYDYIAPKNSFLTDLPFGEKYEGVKIFHDENTSATFFVESIPPFLEANNEFTHQVIFTFNTEGNQPIIYNWFVNIENGEISPIDGDTKNIQQTVDYYD